MLAWASKNSLFYVGLMMVFAVIEPSFAQSSLYYNYLPDGLTPGREFMTDPNESLASNVAASTSVSSSVSSSTNVLNLKAQPKYFSNENFQLQYSLIMLGVTQQSQYEKFQMYSFRIYGDMRYRIGDDFYLLFAPYLIFRTGADQSTEGHSRSGTLLIPKDASLMWMPAAWWQLRGGILDQNMSHSFLLFEDQSFPGARTTFYFGNNRLGASLVGEQSLLTYSANTNNTNQLEENPTFQSASLQGHYQFTSRNQIKASVGYWQFNDLPSSLAADAMLEGNTVRRQSDTLSVFAYQFRGLEARTRLELGIGPVDWNLYAEGLQNSEAPAGMNSAWSAGNELMLRGAKNRKYGINVEYFHIEPDAAVATYNAIEFDRSNRNGVMVYPYFKWGKKQNKISMRYVQSSLVYNNAPQSDLTQFRIRWETDYDFL